MDATVVIPTKNAGELLDKVLSAVFSQKTEYRYEVICVDSGSSDQTLQTIGKYPCRLYQIPPSEFGHGKTRNYGASLGTGEFIVFLTQDALPASEMWLQNFIDAMKLDPDIAGGFGIHYPYPDCNLLDCRNLRLHFEGFGSENTIYQLEDKKRYETEEGYRHFLAFFSDNNSCLRRSVWEQYPYPDVNFAEDQFWAKQMIELGYKKVYCPYAPVYHSHNYKVTTYFSRYFDEFKGLYELHRYVMTDRWTRLPGLLYRQVRMDCSYFRHLDGLTRREKVHWMFYSLFRETAYFAGGYLGGNYHGYSARRQRFLDCHVSQQHRQRRA